MTPYPPVTFAPLGLRTPKTFLLLVLLLFSSAPAVLAETPATTLGIRFTGTDFEGLSSFQLEWNAISNATYLVQSADSLLPVSSWHTLDAVQFPDTAGDYQVRVVATDSTGLPSPPQFYRLILPQPEIFAVEPAVFPPGVAVDAWVIGQCFESNDVVRLDGVVLGSVNFVGTWSAQCTFPPQGAGPHLVELVRGGVVRSAFTVSCADALANPELVLQGPPAAPPSSPQNGAGVAMPVTTSRSDGGGATVGRANFDVSRSDGGGATVGRANFKVSRSDGGGATVGRANFDDCRSAGGGNPVIDPWSGEVRQQVVDLAVAGRGLDFVWVRTYQSRRTGDNQNWVFGYDVRCAQSSSGGMDVYDGTGRKDTYQPQTNGVYTCPGFFREGTLTGGVFRLTFADTGYWEFNPLDAASPDARLARIVDRNGNTMSLNYDDLGRLAQIVDDLGRTNTVAYNTDGLVASITDFSGRTVTYQYYRGAPGEPGGPGDLASVTSPPVTGTPNGNDFPAGKTTSYTYSSGSLVEAENHLLLSTVDGLGQTTAAFDYDLTPASPSYLHCVGLQRGSGPIERITVLPQSAAPANHFAVVRCVLNDAEGNVTEEFYDARGRCVMERDFTGRATPGVAVTDTVNRPKGKLRADDPDYYETQWTWNNDSICKNLVVDSHQIQCIYECDFDKSTRARKRADLRVVRESPSGGGTDTDGDGTLDLKERVWRCECDPNFGSSGDRYLLGLKTYDPTKEYLLGDTVIYNRTGWEKVDNTDSLIINMRDRINSLEASLKNLGLLPKSRSADKRFGIGIKLPESPLGVRVLNGLSVRGADGSNLLLGKSEKPTHCFGAGQPHPQTCDLFITSATDPRGNVATGSYDANGNRVKVQFHWDRTSKGDWDFAYNPHGQLTAITNAPDSNGRRRVDTFAYSQGQVVQCVEDSGAGGLNLTTTLERDARGNVTRLIDPRTNDWLYTWNALDQCVRVQTPVNLTARCATDYFYDENDNLVQCAAELRDAADIVVATPQCRFRFDSLGRVTRTECAVDSTHSLTNDFVYDGNDQCILVLGGDAVSGADPHQAVAYQYDERHLLFREIAAPGAALAGTNEFSYTVTYQPATKKYVDDSDSLKTSFVYDGFDRLTSVTDPMGNQTTFNRDANGNPKVIRRFGQTNDVPGTNGNLRLAECRYEYDGLDRLVRSRDSFFNLPSQAAIGDGERTTSFAYAPNGQCTSITDDLSRVTAFGYDTVGWLSSVTSPGVKTIAVAYRDLAGNVTAMRQTDNSDLGGAPHVFAWTNVYDSLNRRISTTDNVGNTSTCNYDSLSRVVGATDPRGIHSFYSYDLLGRQTLAACDFDGDGLLDITHDAVSTSVWSGSSGQLRATIDGHGNTTSYGYDSLGRCTGVTNADGTRLALVWSPRSNLISEQDANGTVTVHTYDFNDRCISNHIAPGSTVAATTTFETFAYDGCSRLVAARNDVSHNEFEYDSLGGDTGNHRDGWNVLAVNDSLGRRVSLTYPGGRALTYAYDLLDRCTNIVESGASLASFSYDGPGRVARVLYGNGTSAQVTYDGFDGAPNPSGDFGQGEISSVTHKAKDSSSMAAVSLAWDRSGNKSGRTDTIFAPAIPRTNNLTLQYDRLDQLTRAISQNGTGTVRDTQYGLDQVGNRTNVSGAPCSGPYTMDSVVPPGDFQMNRYTTTPCDTRSYDGNGDLVSRSSAVGPVTYQYDYAGRLVQVQALDFNSGTLAPVAAYAYNALGQRISKTVFSGGLPPATTEFFYDGDEVIEEHANGAITATYVTSKFSQKSGTLLQFRRSGQDYYFHADDQGNALALSDSTGAVVERYDFDDYGAVTFLTGDGIATTATSSSVGNAYCWGGLRLDAETGLQNNDGGGYLETTSGRYLLRAGIPLRFEPGSGDYAANNPWTGGSPEAMQKGKVKFFNDAKGFGRIAGGGGGSGGGGGGGGGVFAIESRDTLKTYFETGEIPTQDQRLVSRNILKSFFQKGDKPAQSQFATLIDSTVNKITDRYLLGLSVSGICPGGDRLYPRPGYWSVSGKASKTMTLKGQKILHN